MDSEFDTTALDPSGLDPRQLGRRLQHARKSAGRSQQDAATFLEVARTTITAMEKGERRVQPAELIALAKLYGKPLNEILRSEEPDEAFSIQLRAALAPHEHVGSELEPVVADFQSLCEDYLELERITQTPLVRRYPPERSVPHGAVEAAAEDIAIEERQRLGLGDGPIGKLREILEHDAGARIFYLPMPSRVAAIFAFTDRLGACIAVNQKHPEERRRSSIGHEWAHFLTSRRQPEIEIDGRFLRVPAEERFANAFARSFLLPASGLTRRFNEIKRTREGHGVTVADLLTLAHFFFVSFESMTRRLEELRLVNSGTMDRLRQSRFAVREGQEALGLSSGGDVNDSMLPMRFVFLALQAFRDGLISEGRLSRFLRVDRLEARRVVAESEGTTRTDRT